MFFKNKAKTPLINKKLVILIIGGSGVLGRAFLAKIPDYVFIINVSRQREVAGENILNIKYDVLNDQENLIKKIAQATASVDIMINMAYDSSFSSIDKIDRNVFLREIELDAFIPISLSLLVARNFWTRANRVLNIEQGKKIINISSGASFGKTSRPELASYSGAKAALNIMTEYLHDYLYANFGGSAHIIAPGSLSDSRVMEKTILKIWELIETRRIEFSIDKTY